MSSSKSLSFLPLLIHFFFHSSTSFSAHPLLFPTPPPSGKCGIKLHRFVVALLTCMVAVANGKSTFFDFFSRHR
jgi:hypothetical protein